MYHSEGEECSYTTPSNFNLYKHCQRFCRVRGDSEDDNTRQGRGMSILQSSIAVPEVSDIEVEVDKGSTLDMGDNGAVVVPEKTNNISSETELETIRCLLWLQLRIYFHLWRWWKTTPECHPYWK